MKYYLLSACCFLSLGQSLPAQVNQDLENKYWTYRDRYRNYFTKIGGEAGESQSAASIYQSSVQSLKFFPRLVFAQRSEVRPTIM